MTRATLINHSESGYIMIREVLESGLGEAFPFYSSSESLDPMTDMEAAQDRLADLEIEYIASETLGIE